ncbi:MAG TPA: LuxR C-terminal-related transcriptional regulator [Nocardioidaceae bacterium]|nr:LuxR C-terminal-related transcriptional regulator [Nocardioidaceae bacterium]
MTTDEARQAYDAREWQRAHDLYASEPYLDATDLDRFAIATMLLAEMDEYFAVRERAYNQAIEEGDLVEAAGAALWIGMQRLTMGDPGRGMGWMARAADLVEQDGSDSIPAGVLLMGQAFGAVATGDFDGALALTAQAIAAGRRLRAPDLLALALHQEGQFLLHAGRVDAGVARLDEAMLALTAGDLSPMVTGIIFCGSIEGLWSVHELWRAQQWTAAMTEWCDAQPDLRNFTSECKVRRAELKHLHGAWDDAWAELAGVSPSDVDLWAAGAAACLRGNLDRLQGRYDSAQENFSEAARLGFDPQPGLALLRLAQGSIQAAAAMARRCLAEAEGDAKRVEVLFAAVEILLAAGESQPAADAVAELVGIATRRPISIVTTTSAHADAALHLASGRADVALRSARTALRGWLEMNAPYQEARARLLVADACQVLGDGESAKVDREAARRILIELAAAPDLARLDGEQDVLSPRELEVLRMLATGATNRAIAEKLVLSERTVDRHVSNIFSKLGVSTRAAATAYAFERELV